MSVQNAVVNQEPKELDYKAKETKLREGERSQSAVINQSPKDNMTNTITVDEVKDIVKKGNDEQHIEEILAELEKKADKLGPIPSLVLSSDDDVLAMMKNGTIKQGTGYIFINAITGGTKYMGSMNIPVGNVVYFNLFDIAGGVYYKGSKNASTVKFGDLLKNEFRVALPKTHHYDIGDILTNTINLNINTGDTMVVNNYQFVIQKTSGSTPLIYGKTFGYTTSSARIDMIELRWELNGALTLTEKSHSIDNIHSVVFTGTTNYDNVQISFLSWKEEAYTSFNIGNGLENEAIKFLSFVATAGSTTTYGIVLGVDYSSGSKLSIMKPDGTLLKIDLTELTGATSVTDVVL